MMGLINTVCLPTANATTSKSSAEPKPALMPKPIEDSRSYIGCFFILDAFHKNPPTTGWTYAEQDELCKKIKSGDADSWATLQRQVDMGHAWAQRVMAGFLRESTVVASDPERGLALLLAAAKQGDVSAQDQLGFAFLVGRGAPKDPVQARFWLRKAADQLDYTADTKLAEMLRDGEGGDVDLSGAFSRFAKLAFNKGETLAQIDMAAAFANGQGAEQDWFTAYKWFQIASMTMSKPDSNDNLNKMMDVVKKHLTKKETTEATEQALEWLKAQPTRVQQLPPSHIEARLDPLTPCKRGAFPEESRARGEKGQTLIKLWIAADAKITKSELVQSSGFPLLDNASMIGILKCTFKPALRYGEPVDGTVLIPYKWEDK